MKEIVLSMSSEEERRERKKNFLPLSLGRFFLLFKLEDDDEREREKSEAHQLSFSFTGAFEGRMSLHYLLYCSKKDCRWWWWFYYSFLLRLLSKWHFFLLDLKRVKDKFIFHQNLLIVNVHLDNWKRFLKHRHKTKEKRNVRLSALLSICETSDKVNTFIEEKEIIVRMLLSIYRREEEKEISSSSSTDKHDAMLIRRARVSHKKHEDDDKVSLDFLSIL